MSDAALAALFAALGSVVVAAVGFASGRRQRNMSAEERFREDLMRDTKTCRERLDAIEKENDDLRRKYNELLLVSESQAREIAALKALVTKYHNDQSSRSA